MPRPLTWDLMVEAHRGACVYCGDEPVDQRTLTRDHLTPRSRNGANRLFNVVPACSPCNGEKGDLPLYRFVRKHQRTRAFIERWTDALRRLYGADVDVRSQVIYAHAFAKAIRAPDATVAQLAAMLAPGAPAPPELRDALSARLSADEAKREKEREKARELRRRRAERRRQEREAYEAAMLRWVTTRRGEP